MAGSVKKDMEWRGQTEDMKDGTCGDSWYTPCRPTPERKWRQKKNGKCILQDVCY